MISESNPIGKRTVEKQRNITEKKGNKKTFLFLHFKIERSSLLAAKPVNRPYSIIELRRKCEARNKNIVIVSKPSAPTAKPNDNTHTKRMCCGTKHFCSFDEDVTHISIRPSEVSPRQSRKTNLS